MHRISISSAMWSDFLKFKLLIMQKKKRVLLRNTP